MEQRVGFHSTISLTTILSLTIDKNLSPSGQEIAIRDPDVRLMLEVREGNATAFEKLMLRFQGRVLSVLTHAVGNQELARDLTQDVFLRVYRARLNYVPGAKFSTWLFTIVNNVALNALRGKSRRPEVQFGQADWGTGVDESRFQWEDAIQASSGMIPTRLVDKMELNEIVRHAIDSLGERQRIATMLHRFEGMSYAEIAETMGLTPQAVKSLLCRARLTLKEILLPYVEEGKVR